MLQILVADFSDDETSIADELFLHNNHHAVFKASTYSEWESLFGESPFDCFCFILDGDTYHSYNAINALRRKPPYTHTPIIIFSSCVEHVFSAFLEWHCCEFFILPMNKEKNKALSGLLHYYANTTQKMHVEKNNTCQIHTDKKILNLHFDDILFLESSMKKTIFHLKDGVCLVPLPLCRISEQLDNPSFLQTHRSYIVNTKNISSIDKSIIPWTIHFQNSKKMAFVSRGYKNSAATTLFHESFSNPSR